MTLAASSHRLPRRADGRVVKGVQFRALRNLGDPATLAAAYEAEGADEVVLLDITASAEERATQWDMVRRTAEQVFIPLTIGGGIRSLPDMLMALRSGADKVTVNSAAVARPELLTQAAEWFGAQCVVASIDARRDAAAPSGWGVVTHGGRQVTTRRCRHVGGRVCRSRGRRDPVDQHRLRRQRGGYDIPSRGDRGNGSSPRHCLRRRRTPGHVCAVLETGGADAALVAGILHDGLRPRSGETGHGLARTPSSREPLCGRQCAG